MLWAIGGICTSAAMCSRSASVISTATSAVADCGTTRLADSCPTPGRRFPRSRDRARGLSIALSTVRTGVWVSADTEHPSTVRTGAASAALEAPSAAERRAASTGGGRGESNAGSPTPSPCVAAFPSRLGVATGAVDPPRSTPHRSPFPLPVSGAPLPLRLPCEERGLRGIAPPRALWRAGATFVVATSRTLSR